VFQLLQRTWAVILIIYFSTSCTSQTLFQTIMISSKSIFHHIYFTISAKVKVQQSDIRLMFEILRKNLTEGAPQSNPGKYNYLHGHTVICNFKTYLLCTKIFHKWKIPMMSDTTSWWIDNIWNKDIIWHEVNSD
jgi:hypothetical protein